MSRISAGLLLYRWNAARLEVLLVHPGGPYWAKRDQGAWSIPKGEVEPGEEALAAAFREFHEETGFEVAGHAIPLGQIRQRSGKIVVAWAMPGDVDPRRLHSNTMAIEWPPRSGSVREFPEVDRGEWFDLVEARRRIVAGQAGFLDTLVRLLGDEAAGA
jgi:predicted NUDIX family NTP pyrophosphohydrolase